MVDTPAVAIRPANEADLEAVLGLYAQPGYDDCRMLSIADARKMLERFRSYPDYTLYIAEFDGSIVGTFALLIMDNFGHLGTPSAVVEGVVVAPHMQSLGIGQIMMDFARDRSTEKGCYKVVLSSNVKRERAHAFYERLGYQIYGYSFRLDVAPRSP
ncbi:MAG TPA: GNAT family N-acetyltransferase [Xanthobacteraceae bacterium]